MFSRLAAAALLASVPVAQAATSAPFSYDPDSIYGPQNWGKLPMDDNACDGKSNSPVAITKGECDRFENYRFDNGSCNYASMSYSLTNTGVKASFPGDDSCVNPTVRIPGINGVYKALQFHIHTSSEHTIDGNFYGAELHTVHGEVDGDRFAVIGMMIQPDATEPNDLFDVLLTGWEQQDMANRQACANPAPPANVNPVDTPVDTPGGAVRKLQDDIIFAPYNLLPEGTAFFHYDGGLTTPPCSEVVWWNLADTAVAVTPAQYMRLVDLVVSYIDASTCKPGTNAGPVGSTSRPVQPLYGRIVERVCPAN